jgi:hypothetical protein
MILVLHTQCNEEDSSTLNLPIWLLDAAFSTGRDGGAKAKH